MAGEQAVLEIDLRAVVANWRALCARHPSGPVAGVVKADGYGLGAREVAAALHRAGCRHFFVAYLNEALAIRDVVPGAMLGVLSGLIHGTEDEYVAHDLTPVLGSFDEIARWRGRGGATRSCRSIPGCPGLVCRRRKWLSCLRIIPGWKG